MECHVIYGQQSGRRIGEGGGDKRVSNVFFKIYAWERGKGNFITQKGRMIHKFGLERGMVDFIRKKK